MIYRIPRWISESQTPAGACQLAAEVSNVCRFFIGPPIIKKYNLLC